MPAKRDHHPSSFRDPSGFIFEKDAVIYRQVNQSFKMSFDAFINGGCYKELVKKGLLIPHEQSPVNHLGDPEHYLTLQPERIPFVTYQYEWTFGMLKDAALLTLAILKEALLFNMILKDATPFNIQWYKGKLIFIDSLSFEPYDEKPWIAYRQFCETFVGPLLIMHYFKKQLPSLQLAWPDGVPLDIIRNMLPRRSRFKLHTYLHIHLHAKMAARRGNEHDGREASFSRQKLSNLVSSLETVIEGLKIPKQTSTWSAYYDEASKRGAYLTAKKRIIERWLTMMPDLHSAIDLGANEGEFAQLCSARGIATVAADFDPYCIEALYDRIKTGGERSIQPMVLDLANPTPSIGVNNEERSSFLDRASFDLALALAVVHHLAIGRNLPFDSIARLLSKSAKRLIVEFVPKEDEKVQLMLKAKKDIYTDYSEANFTEALSRYFNISERREIEGSTRVLFLLERR